MKRYTALGFLGLGLMVSPMLSGLGHSAVPASPKIGVIDIENTLSTTPAGKRANDEFDKTRKSKQAELDKQQEALKQASADLDKQKAVLKADVYETKRSELEKKFVDLQQTYVKLERELAAARTELVQKLLKSAEPKILDIAKAEGVQIIIDQSATIWIDPAVDLTAKLNAQMK